MTRRRAAIQKQKLTKKFLSFLSYTPESNIAAFYFAAKCSFQVAHFPTVPTFLTKKIMWRPSQSTLAATKINRYLQLRASVGTVWRWLVQLVAGLIHCQAAPQCYSPVCRHDPAPPVHRCVVDQGTHRGHDTSPAHGRQWMSLLLRLHTVHINTFYNILLAWMTPD